MVRKDERGVVILAPVQFNNPATASLPRFDDQHRGPGVADAYALSHCWVDLAVHSEAWDAPENFPSRLVELAQSIPEEQRADWLRKQANLKEVERLISYAMRTGDLPIWVAPIGELEQMVAPGALVEVDRATIVSGCYRPPNDRGWLYGRPLFVKKDDWVQFVAKVEDSKATYKGHSSKIAPAPLPSAHRQKMSLSDAIRELHQRVKAAVHDPDPAPWLDVSPFHIEMFCEGDEAAFVRRKKMENRSMLVLQRALLSGAVRSHFSDGIESRDVPGWAWVGAERNEHVWFEGRLPLDVFLPEEWQRWSCHSVYLDRDAFTAWMDGQTLHDPIDLPALLPPYDAQTKPEPVKKRLPPDAPFVTLSEALTWIAFGFALDRDSLDRAISGHAFDATDPQAALAAAMAKLAVRASGDQIATRGKYVESHSTDENKVLTEPIDPVRFEDFAQFDILYDGLRYGTGLTWERRNSTLDRVLQDRRDAFRSVKVSRADLLKLFPDQDDMARALFVPLPAALPEIGPVMPLDEALSWLAHGKPSHDIEIWQNTAGDLMFRDSSGAVIEPRADGSIPPFIETYRQASRTIHEALRDGSLLAYVAPVNSIPLLVSRFYWNGVNPDLLHLVYRGVTPDDKGAGCPVLLSRQAFGAWRASLPILSQPEKREQAKKGRKRPGPAPDPDWPHAITKVTQDCISAGYMRPLKRGDKAAIQTMLLTYMADKDKHFSDDIAAKHAETVIAALPDN